MTHERLTTFDHDTRMTIAEASHIIAKSKGFWNIKKDLKTFRMLIITELSEMVEAHRKSKYANVDGYMSLMKKYTTPYGDLNDKEYIMDFRTIFESYIKDSFEDEMADTYIRLGDLLGHYIEIGEYDKEFQVKFAPSGINMDFCPVFSLHLTKILSSDDFRPVDLLLCMAILEEYAVYMGVDLLLHINLKSSYNKTRGLKFGKNY